MQPNIKQEPQTVKKQNYLKRWMKNFLFILLGIIGFFSIVLVAGGIYVAYQPINVTPLVKYWLPLPVVKGHDTNHPAGVLTVDKVVLEWPVIKQGLGAPLQIEIQKAYILDTKQNIQGSIQYGKIALEIAPLFHGTIEPLSLQMEGANLRLKKTENQTIQLDLPDQKPSKSKSKIQFNFRRLNQIIIHDSHIQLIDSVAHKQIQLQKIDMNILPFFAHNTLSIIGHVMAQLDIDGHMINIRAQSGNQEDIEKVRQTVAKTGRLQWNLQIDHINPSDFANIHPSLHSLSQIDLPISMTAEIGLKIDKKQSIMTPYNAYIMLNMGKGKIGLKGQNLYPSSIKARFHAQFSSDLQKPVHLLIDDIALQLRSPKALNQERSGPLFEFSGDLSLSSLIKTKDVKVNFIAKTSELNFATIKDYWPATIAKGAHEWVTQNITAGVVKGFEIKVGLSSKQGWKDLDLVELGGGIKEADHAEIHWLRPVPPIKDMKASLQFVDPSRIHIQFQNGYQVVYPHNKPTDRYMKLAIPKGDMWITGLNNHQETGIINVDIQGKLQDLITLLYEPRLKLLSRHPLPFKRPSGEVKTTLKVEVPLKKKVKIEQISIKGHNEVSHAYLDHVALDRDLIDGFLTIDVDTQHLELTGKGIFSVFPVTLKYMQKFTHKNNQSIIETADAKLDITPANLKKMKVDPSDDLSGRISLLVGYEKRYSGLASVKLKFDLLNAGLQLPIWQKTIGQPAYISGEIALDQSKLVAIKNLSAQGKDLAVYANIDVQNHIPRQLKITSFRIGRSVGKASVNFPMTKEAINNPQKGDIRLTVNAKTLDAVPFVNKYVGTKTKKKKYSAKQKNSQYQLPIAATGRYSGPRGRKWVVNLQAQKIYYHKDQFLGNVTTYMEYNGVRLMRLSYGMRKPFLVTASLFPKGQYRYFHLEAQDFGRILETLGVATELGGGSVVFEGKFNDSKPSAPFDGQIQIKNVILEKAPLAMRRLSDASIYGLFKGRKGKEIILDMIKTNLTFNDGILYITNGLVHNAELGATLQGDINLDRDVLNLKGTIVPVYAINKLFGHLPLVGKLFTPEKGGGFVAIPFDIAGSFKKPVFDLYPLRILTPGALRELY